MEDRPYLYAVLPWTPQICHTTTAQPPAHRADSEDDRHDLARAILYNGLGSVLT
jgi:hypothetical protein